MIKIHVTNLTGEEFPLLATTTNDLDLNGNQSLSLKITSNKVNDLFIDNLTEMWTVTDHEDVEYKIIYAKKKGEGDRLYVDVKAIPLFFDKFDTLRIYEEYNKHMTAHEAFTLIFKDTGFNFVLVDSFLAVEWEGFAGGESRLETFKRALERYKAEFRISGNTIYLEAQIGRDTSHMYRYKLNASNIVQEIDASALWTYAKGYGDYGDGDGGEDWKDAKLIKEYTSPLAQIIGVRHAPPIQNGNIKVASSMDNALKTLVNESLKISVSADLHDLTKQGYPIAQSELGDRVFLIDERIGLNEEVRVVEKSITRDWRGNILDLNLVFGSEGIAKRHQSEMKTAVDRINELIEGKIKLPFSVLDNAVAEATKALQAARTELTFGDNGILSVDKNNPNFVTLLNSAGFGVSVDGGATFKQSITGRGVVAETLIGKILIGQNLLIENEGSSFYVDKSGVRLNGGSLVITGGLPDGQISNASRWNNRTTRITNEGVYTGVVTAEQVNTGTLNADNVRIRGGSSTSYTDIHGAFLESRGRHTRTWRGTTRTHDIRLMLENGYFRARNNNENWSLYFSDWGISTYADGTGDDDASGYIEFHSRDYSPTNSPSGLTIGSLGGRIGIETAEARIYLNTAGSGVHVGNPNDVYYSIYAASFTQSSARKLKRDIMDLQDSGIDVVKSLRIREYRRLRNGEETSLDTWQAGLILDEAPIQFIDGLGIDMYTAWAYTTKAVQELIQRLEVLENGTTQT